MFSNWFTIGGRHGSHNEFLPEGKLLTKWDAPSLALESDASSEAKPGRQFSCRRAAARGDRSGGSTVGGRLKGSGQGKPRHVEGQRMLLNSG